MGALISLSVNGRNVELAVPAPTPLLYALQNDLALNDPKYGCGPAECGACASPPRNEASNFGVMAMPAFGEALDDGDLIDLAHYLTARFALG